MFFPSKSLLRNKTFCCGYFIGAGGKPALYTIPSRTTDKRWGLFLGAKHLDPSGVCVRVCACVCACVCVTKDFQGYGGSEEAVPSCGPATTDGRRKVAEKSCDSLSASQ